MMGSLISVNIQYMKHAIPQITEAKGAKFTFWNEKRHSSTITPTGRVMITDTKNVFVYRGEFKPEALRHLSRYGIEMLETLHNTTAYSEDGKSAFRVYVKHPNLYRVGDELKRGMELYIWRELHPWTSGIGKDKLYHDDVTLKYFLKRKGMRPKINVEWNKGRKKHTLISTGMEEIMVVEMRELDGHPPKNM